MKKIFNKHIVADSEICHGKLTFRGTRIMVWQIIDMLSAGMTEKEILEEFPSLKSDHIKAALEFATAILSEDKYAKFDRLISISR
ncbi:MAG: DUF433 domain-containing protein [bacterium]|nr:DUF433 domain-containing protein [bacterium]